MGQLVTTTVSTSFELVATPSHQMIEPEEKLIQLLNLQGANFLKLMFYIIPIKVDLVLMFFMIWRRDNY